MVGRPPEEDLARVDDAVEQLRLKANELRAAEQDFESLRHMVEPEPARQEPRLQGRDPNHRWHHDRTKRVAGYAVLVLVGACASGAYLDHLTKAYNQPANDQIASDNLGVERRVLKLIAGNMQAFQHGVEVTPEEYRALYTRVPHQGFPQELQFINSLPVTFTLLMLSVVALIEAIYLYRAHR
jgi:hypothetical protein